MSEHDLAMILEGGGGFVLGLVVGRLLAIPILARMDYWFDGHDGDEEGGQP